MRMNSRTTRERAKKKVLFYFLPYRRRHSHARSNEPMQGQQHLSAVELDEIRSDQAHNKKKAKVSVLDLTSNRPRCRRRTGLYLVVVHMHTPAHSRTYTRSMCTMCPNQLSLCSIRLAGNPRVHTWTQRTYLLEHTHVLGDTRIHLSTRIYQDTYTYMDIRINQYTSISFHTRVC